MDFFELLQGHAAVFLLLLTRVRFAKSSVMTEAITCRILFLEYKGMNLLRAHPEVNSRLKSEKPNITVF